jgi:hypothetical protein
VLTLSSCHSIRKEFTSNSGLLSLKGLGLDTTDRVAQERLQGVINQLKASGLFDGVVKCDAFLMYGNDLRFKLNVQCADSESEIKFLNYVNVVRSNAIKLSSGSVVQSQSVRPGSPEAAFMKSLESMTTTVSGNTIQVAFSLAVNTPETIRGPSVKKRGELTEKDQRRADTYLRTAKNLAKLDKINAAIENAKQAIEVCPGSESAKEAQKLIHNLKAGKHN